MEMFFFTILFVVIVVEMILNSTWNRIYFTYGIPVFSYQPSSRCSAQSVIDTEELEKSLQSPKYASFKVRRFSDEILGFREAAWGGLGKTSYSPMMRGKLEINNKGQVKVTGFVNWFVIIISIAFIGLTVLADHSNPNVLGFPIILFVLIGWIYLLQKKRFKELADLVVTKLD
ncbi:hypothetical protein ACXJY6_04525 [Vibrio sp. RC27]